MTNSDRVSNAIDRSSAEGRPQMLSVVRLSYGGVPEQDPLLNGSGLAEHTRDHPDRELSVGRILAGRRGVDAGARETLRLVLPDIAAAARWRRPLSEAPPDADEFKASFDALDEALILLDQRATVRHLNRRAARMAARGDGFIIRERFVLAAERESRPALDGLIASALQLAAGDRVERPEPATISRRGHARPLIATAFIVHDRSSPQVAVLLRLRERPDLRIPPVERVVAELGLTPSEAALAVALAEGATLTEYAKATGVSENTVRTHLRNMRTKLDVRRQSEVVRRVLTLGLR